MASARAKAARQMPFEDQRRKRPRGHPAGPNKGVRLPIELEEVANSAGRSRNDGITRLVDLANDARTELGKEGWLDVEAFASRQEIYEGQALGRLAALGVEAMKSGVISTPHPPSLQAVEKKKK